MSDDGDRFAASQAELVEVVDEDGMVIEITTRERMRAAGLRHRCTYVAVVTADQELVVHRRAEWKDVYPGYWDLCFGGICGVGESWPSAAVRELAEEAGLVDVELQDLGAVRHEGADGKVLGRVFLGRTDVGPTCADGEVVVVDRIPVQHLERWLEGRPVCADSRDAALPLVLRRLRADR